MYFQQFIRFLVKLCEICKCNIQNKVKCYGIYSSIYNDSGASYYKIKNLVKVLDDTILIMFTFIYIMM